MKSKFDAPSTRPSPLLRGTKKAIRVHSVRLPPDISPDLQEIADEAFDVYVSIIRGEIKVPAVARNMLQAATRIREEINGPIVKKVELKTSLADLLAIADRHDTIEGQVIESPRLGPALDSPPDSSLDSPDELDS